MGGRLGSCKMVCGWKSVDFCCQTHFVWLWKGVDKAAKRCVITCMLTKHYGMFAAQLLARCNATRNACAVHLKLNVLNLVFNFYKTAPPRWGVLEKTEGKKHRKCHIFPPFLPPFSSFWGWLTCILHHLAFLVWLPTHYFSRPISHF